MYLNKIKYQRAVAACGKDATEEQIKAAYVNLGGVVVEDEVVETPVSPEKVEEESIVKKIVKKVTKKK